MSSPEDLFDYLEEEIAIDQQVRLGASIIEVNENISALSQAYRDCSDVFDDIESIIDQMEQR